MALSQLPHHPSLNWFVKKCIQVLFPQACMLCERDIPKSLPTPVCPTCYSKIPWRTHPMVSPGPPVDVFYTSTEFSGHAKELVHAFKYNGKDYLAPLMVDVMTRYWPDHLETFDALVPVPMPAWREIRRGYNQAALLAEELGRRLKVPVIHQWLSRGVLSRSQTKLGRQGREENAASQFRIRGNPVVIPERVLLIDDVCTTGATLRRCATLLKSAGVGLVGAGTISHEF